MKNVDLVLVNDKDRIVGYKEKFETHKLPVSLHRAISVVILDPTGNKMMLQKRTKIKPTWPLFWSNACCTHPYREEDYLESATRRIREEMGFDVALRELFRFIYQTEYDDIWGENEYDVIFEGVYQGSVNPNPEEAAEWKWIPINELLLEIKQNPDVYTPWFKVILERKYQ
ncbi:isopentenyl-diphosphate Delta-isomerase, partial [Candidatus Amesbacteria bacterium]|nr:isopentenyl-diphosphate Delta-isomerase [Candidatus Amesbacteria bacterium]